MNTTLTSAGDRFFYDERALTSAQMYLRIRAIDAAKLRAELKFSFYTERLMRCHIYGHTIVLSLGDGDLYPNSKAGMCELYARIDGDDAYRGTIEQVLAYILATNW
jgi:hypothetical protein